MWIGMDNDKAVYLYEDKPAWNGSSFDGITEEGKDIQNLARIDNEYYEDIRDILKLEPGDLLEFQLIKRNGKTPIESIMDVSDN